MAPGSTAAPHGWRAARALQVAGEYRKRALDPVDRFSEVIFGLIMVLAFTCSLSVAESGQQQVRQMLVAALGCNLAWGIVDGVMYLLTAIAERSRRALVIQGIREADPAAARAIVQGTISEGLTGITDDAAADRIVARLRALPDDPHPPWLTVEDLKGALGSSILVVLATFPPTIPFLLVADATRALRISNALAVVTLFLAGYWLGKATGARAWLLGLAMVVLGSAMVGLTIALGG